MELYDAVNSYVLPKQLSGFRFRFLFESLGILMTNEEAVKFHLGQIFKKFPNDSAVAASLYYSRESFRSLCEDYSLALITLSSMEKSSAKSARISEYQSIISDLEAEIRIYLARCSGGG